MKLYTFTHRGLSPVAKGIQAQHALAELFVKYNESEEIVNNTMIHDWAENYKTIISLDGGTSIDLKVLIEFLEYESSPYPWSYFVEDETFENMTTAVAIVLPQKIYFMAHLVRTKEVELKETYFHITSQNSDEITRLNNAISSYGNFSDFEIELINKIAYARTAQ